MPYRLNLPEGLLIHPVFHISQLKKIVGDGYIVNSSLPLAGPEGKIRIEPIAIIDRRVVKKRNCAVPNILVRWSNLADEDATWEE